MNANDWVELIVAVLSGICVCIPLVQKIIVLTRKNVQEKNWPALMDMVMTYMEKAEGMFEEGSDKKAWVLGAIETSQALVNYDIDMDVVSAMIDQICDTSKVVNAPSKASKRA